MTKEDCFLLGTLVKTHGYSGQIVLKINQQYQEKLEILESVFLLMDGILVPFFIEEMEEYNISSFLLKIDEINSKNEAAGFIGKDVFLSVAEFEKENHSNQSSVSVIGYQIRSESNLNLGYVKEIREIPGNPLFVISYMESEVMIPANDELILDINHKDKIISMTIPDGLLPD